MLAIQEYIKDNKLVIMDNNTSVLEGKRVIITILDDAIENIVQDSEKQRQIFSDFINALKADPNKLSSDFDDVTSNGIKLREYDWL